MVLFPGRCRAIPEANNPDHCVLRQVAIVKRYVYLQQFASAEDREWMHSHQWEWTIAVGLWGGYTEFRLAGRPKKRTAPYFYTMDSSIVHHVQRVTPGHTSVFVGLFRNDDLKFYFPAHGEKRHWETHIKTQVKRV